MIPTKNGVDVWLEEYDCWVRTDRYDLDDTLILRTSNTKIYAPIVPNEHTLRVHRIDHWFDEHAPAYGTMIVRHGDWNPY